MAKHLDWMRTRAARPEDVDVAQFEGRKLLGALMESVKLGGITQGVRRRVLDDGTVVEARFDGTTPIVTVLSGPSTATKPSGRIRAATWIPRGFVLYPISEVSEKGWGVPVVNDLGTLDPYAPSNLAPGLDTTRWTEGGPLGQVLLTQVPGAGYPDSKPYSLAAPLYYHERYGLRTEREQPASGETWGAYRIEFEDFSAQSPGATRDGGLLTAARRFKREMFDLVNALRMTYPGRTELLLPIRGFYDSAQATAEVMASTQVVGHFYEGFARTYETPDDRGTKDGLLLSGLFIGYTTDHFDDRSAPVTFALGENLTGSGNVTEVLGTDPAGLPISLAPSAGSMTAQEVFDQFLTSPGHTANMVRVDYNTQPNIGQAASLAVGARPGYYGQHFRVRDCWLAAGNQQWYPPSDDLPILSWDGYNSMNLAWDTWGIQFLVNLDAFTATAYLAEYFTVGLVDPEAAHVINQFYSDTPAAGEDRRHRHALSPRIYARGRCFALAPHGGLVWAAGVQPIPGPPGEPAQQHRLVALVHHPEDQGADPLVLTSGATPVLRVWYIDLPVRNGVSLGQESLIMGVYGEEDVGNHGWPWTEINNPCSWKGGAAVNVTDSNTLLKYASVWRFSPDGTKAVCLRDYGTVSDYETEYLRSQCDPPGAGVLGPTLDASYLMSGQLGVFTGARYVKRVELDLTDPEAPTLTVSDVNYGAAPQRLLSTYAAAFTGSVCSAAWIRPAAVDYAPDGSLVYAFHVICFYAGAYQTAGVHLDNVNQSRHGIYFGADWDTTYAAAAPSTIWYSSVVGLPDAPYMGAPASVIDVRDRVWAHVGAPCSAVDTGMNPLHPGNPDYPLYVPDSPDSLYRTFDFTAECLSCTLVPSEHIIRMYRMGSLLLEHTIPNDDDLVHDFRLFPNKNPRFIPLSTNPALQATYVRDHAGNWIATLNYIPQAFRAYRILPYGPSDSATFYWGNGDNECLNACGMAWKPINTVRPVIGFPQTKNCGGGMTSSFATQVELITMMNIPGSSPRSPYARVV